MPPEIHGYILLADCVRSHPDGTFSLVRGGLDRFTVDPESASDLRASMLVRIFRPPEDETDDREVRVSIIGPRKPEPVLEAVLTLPAESKGLWSTAGIDFVQARPAVGGYTLELRISGLLLDSCYFKVTKE